MAHPTDTKEVLDFALDIARRAGERVLTHFRSADLNVDAKADGSPVTIADRDAERFLREQIEQRFPEDAILGEEEAERPGKSGRRWLLDPIDGTKAFSRGVPIFANLVAVHDETGPLCGVIHLPALSETVYAGRGLGCFENGRPVRVSQRRELRGAYLATSATDNWPPAVWRAVHEAGIQVRTWGDAYGYALTATGRVDAMVDPSMIEWYDIAPMPVIFAEAGGRFTDIEGTDRIDTHSGVASNGALHDELLALLRS
jgi:histidinol-phosphatase